MDEGRSSGMAGLSAVSVEPRTVSAPARLLHPLPTEPYEAAKRVVDISVSLVLLPVAVPLIALAALAVVLTTGQQPFFLQTRAGQGGRPFRMIKLRTMRVSSPDPASSKQRDDPRVTAVGRVLRRTSLDELPQLLNVLAGQMSLVGPRPALPSELAEYPVSWRRCLDVKPGLTGLWQVRGRSTLPLRQRVALDRWYIRRRSMAFDAWILVNTIGAVASMRGAW